MLHFIPPQEKYLSIFFVLFAILDHKTNKQMANGFFFSTENEKSLSLSFYTIVSESKKGLKKVNSIFFSSHL